MRVAYQLTGDVNFMDDLRSTREAVIKRLPANLQGETDRLLRTLDMAVNCGPAPVDPSDYYRSFFRTAPEPVCEHDGETLRDNCDRCRWVDSLLNKCGRNKFGAPCNNPASCCRRGNKKVIEYLCELCVDLVKG